LLSAGQPRQARELLKKGRSRHQAHRALNLLLARSYWELGNLVWVRRTLNMLAKALPKDCLVRSWQIRLHLKQAELQQADDLLVQEECPGESAAIKGRWELLRATLARYRQDPEEAAEAIALVRAGAQLFEEDRPLLGSLSSYALPWRVVPLRLRLEVGEGYTSNGLMSTPADVASSGAGEETGSAMLSLDAQVQMEAPISEWFRPVLELGLRSMLLLNGADVSSSNQAASWDYSYLKLNLRPGVALGPLRVFYASQIFLLTGGDKYTENKEGPRWYYETHRGELEWEPLSWLILWGGAGTSLFREQARTRIEVDGGVGVLGPVWRLRLLGAVTVRKHLAELDAYSLWGGTLLGSATLPLDYLSIRTRLIVSFDLYPDSAAFFKNIDDRQDWLIKGGLELWSRSWHGQRAGLCYEISHRLSSVPEYQYMDHRVLVRIRWSWQWDPWAPKTATPPADHVALPQRTGGPDRLEDERIQDMLRQEDAARRGSSCVN